MAQVFCEISSCEYAFVLDEMDEAHAITCFPRHLLYPPNKIIFSWAQYFLTELSNYANIIIETYLR